MAEVWFFSGSCWSVSCIIGAGVWNQTLRRIRGSLISWMRLNGDFSNALVASVVGGPGGCALGSGGGLREVRLGRLTVLTFGVVVHVWTCDHPLSTPRHQVRIDH